MTRRRRALGPYVRRIRSQSLSRTLRDFADPAKLTRHARQLFAGEVNRTNPYAPSFSPDAEARFAADLIGHDEAAVRRAFDELEADRDFVRDLQSRYERVRAGSTLHVGRFEILYAIVRLTKPTTIIETGVHDGLSSAVTLRALARNGRGVLASVDLPSTDQPTSSGPGWLVPDDHLRDRWNLRLGDARDLLPRVAAESAPIDLFFHDSDHSPTHQEFEFRTVKAHASPAAVFLSDQDYPFEPLLDMLAAEWGFAHHRVRTVSGDPGDFMGGLAAPSASR